MNRSERSNFRSFVAATLMLLVLAAVTMLTPASAIAATTGANGTIINVVDVSWKIGTATFHNQAFSTVTVATLAAAPNFSRITADKTVSPGAFVSYSAAVSSTSNGPDTYTIEAGAVTRTNINAVTYNSPANVALFGSYTPKVSGAGGTIFLPGGSVGASDDLLKDKYLIIGPKIYQVTGNTKGTAPTGAKLSGTDVPEPLTPEDYAVVTLAAVTGIWGFTGTNAGDLAALAALPIGTQIGEVKAVGILTLTANNPNNPTVNSGNGTHSNPFTIKSGATDLAGAFKSSSALTFLTTVQATNVTISKWFRTITGTNGVAGATITPIDPSNPGASGFFPGNTAVDSSTAGKTAPKPGEYIIYLIVIKNDGATAATDNTIYDPMPSYTTYEAGSTYIVKNITGSQALVNEPDSGITSVIAVGGGYNTLQLDAGSYTMIQYQVKVN